MDPAECAGVKQVCNQLTKVGDAVDFQRRLRCIGNSPAGSAGIEKCASGLIERVPDHCIAWPRQQPAFGPPVDFVFAEFFAAVA